MEKTSTTGINLTTVFLLSIPKSGTHFMIEVLQQALGSYLLYMPSWGSPPKDYLEWVDGCYEGTEWMATKKSHLLVPTHNPGHSDDLLDRIRNRDDSRGILLIRDPRDLIVSYIKSTQAGIWPEGDLARYYVDKTEREIYINTMEHFETNLKRYTIPLHAGDYTIVRYEDLLGIDRGGRPNMQGRAIDDIAKALSICSLDVARGLLTAINRPTYTRREGGARCGQWKELFTEEMIGYIKKFYGRTLIDWGYESDEHW